METKTILNTALSGMYDLSAKAKDTASWIIKNKAIFDATQDKYVSIINGINPMVKTPISEVFNIVKDSGDLSNILFISTILNKKLNVPELLTVNDVSIYGKQIPGIKDAELKKSWLNISSHLAPPSKSRFDSITISAANDVMSLVVRNMFCMAYADNKNWLSPKLLSFVIEFYAVMMTAIVDRRYKLDLQDAVVCKYAFAYYYASLLSSDTNKSGAPVLLNKLDQKLFRGMAGSNADMANSMAEIRQGKVCNMEHIVQFIKSFGPARLDELSVSLLYRAQSVASHSSIASVIAVDYPPYLVWLIFQSIAGNKHPIISDVINNKFKSSYIKTNVTQLIKYGNLYSGAKPNG